METNDTHIHLFLDDHNAIEESNIAFSDDLRHKSKYFGAISEDEDGFHDLSVQIKPKVDSKNNSDENMGWNGKDKLFTCLTCQFTTLGLIANIITLLTLSFNGRALPLIGRYLLIHQATVDSFVCLMSLGMYLEPFMCG